MNRRSFLKRSVAGAGAAIAISKFAVSAIAAETTSAKKAVLKLCSQEWLFPGRNVKEKAEKVLAWGGCGLEFGGIDVKRAEEIRRQLEGTGVRPAALCWGSDNGKLVSADLEVRRQGIDDLKKVLKAAGALGSTGVIWVPCFNGQSNLNRAELDKILYEILPEIGDYAQKVNSRLLIEPLNKRETFYINRLDQAAEFCNKLDNPGVCMMGDFYHMAKEEKSEQAAFLTGGKWIHHVHLATGPSRILPGQERHSFVDGFTGLKRIGYQDFCSLECGVKPTRATTDASGKSKLEADPDREIPKAFAFLKQQWQEADV
jgi:sugar phosphate isomerase/epimerase